MVLLNLLASIGATLLAYGLYKAFNHFYAQITSPLRDIPGPSSPSFFYGNFKQIWDAENSVLHEEWVQKYGLTFKYKGILNIDRLFTMDTKALNYVLMNSMDYQKPGPARYNLSRMLGNGILVVEGEQHRRQRKIMNPAFGPTQIRALTSIFFGKAFQLRDIWASDISKLGDKQTPIDVLSSLSKVTLDIIGLAGFDYRFNALEPSGKPNDLNQAFSTVFKADAQLSVYPLLQAMFPPLRALPLTRRQKIIQQARLKMNSIGQQLVNDSKAAVMATVTEKGGFSSAEKKDEHARDLLSLLIRANMDTDLPESQRLSDEDVLSQVPTFLVAGHETTSTATTWALYALTQDPAVQTKLRKELLSVATETPTMDELNALPYLDAVIRETMRLHAPVPSTFRVAMKDDVLPLNTPFVDKKGILRHGISIRKGETLIIPILAMNRAKSLWGEDAMEFRPERWESIPEAVSSIPGVWGNMLSFLGGPRSCIGYRFSLVEMKALLFVLVRAFEFELAVPPEDVIKKTAIVQRPLIRSAPDDGNKMPLWVRHYKAP